MLQGWDKFCFRGGVLEIEAKLPGRWDVGGLWPGLWMMGNLAGAAVSPRRSACGPFRRALRSVESTQARSLGLCDPAPLWPEQQAGRGGP